MSKWAAVGAVAGIACALFLGGKWLMHVDQEGQYSAYVREYATDWRSSTLRGVPQQDRVWLAEHHDMVLAEGQASCAWLEKLPEVPDIVPSGDADSGKIREQYLDETSSSTQMAVNERTRSGVITGAWAYLCPDIKYSRTSPSIDPDELD
jgi:hypothetical protein